MASKRHVSWQAAIGDLRHDHPSLLVVREEPLRFDLPAEPGALPLSAWRGRSGRRYVVSRHEIDDADLAGTVDAVMIAVRRTGMTATIVGSSEAGPQPEPEMRRLWMIAMRGRGACEIHLHRLGTGSQERRRIMQDLRS